MTSLLHTSQGDKKIKDGGEGNQLHIVVLRVKANVERETREDQGNITVQVDCTPCGRGLGHYRVKRKIE